MSFFSIMMKQDIISKSEERSMQMRSVLVQILDLRGVLSWEEREVVSIMSIMLL